MNAVFDIFYFGSSVIARYFFTAIVSIFSAIIFLLIFKKTSNQNIIKAHKDKIFGNLLQLTVYKDKLDLLFLSIISILKYNCYYIKQTLVPLLIICVPLIFFTLQVNNYCGYEPLKSNHRFIIKAQIENRNTTEKIHVNINDVYCETSPEIFIETPPLRIEKEGTLFWRAKVVDSSINRVPYIRIGVQGTSRFVEKAVAVNHMAERFSPDKIKGTVWDRFLNNSVGGLPEDVVFNRVSIDYKRARLPFFFWKVDSIFLYFLLTLVFALILKNFFRVII